MAIMNNGKSAGKLTWAAKGKRILGKAIPRRITTAALDIGAGEIKFVSLDPDKPVVVTAVRYPMQEEVLEEPPGEDVLSGILENLVSEHGLTGTEVISVLGGDTVITRHVKLPKMRSGDLYRAVLAEAGNVAPHPPEELMVRHIVLGSEQCGNEHLVDVLFAAAPRDMIYSYYALLSRCGLMLTVLDLPAVALWRLYRNEISSAGGITAILDVGAARTILVIARDDRLLFTRTLPVGGYLLVRSVAETYGVDFAQARNILEHDARVLSERELSGACPAAMQMDISLRSGLGEMVREFRRSLEFYYARDNAEQPLTGVILTGGTSKLPGFDVFLSEALNIPAQIIKPAGIDFSEPAVFEPSLAVACGLALREARY